MIFKLYKIMPILHYALTTSWLYNLNSLQVEKQIAST